MLKNYLTVTLRTLLKYKSFSLINILGLAIGMPVCLLIILAVKEQRNIDQFHTNKDRIYRVITWAKNKSTGQAYDYASAPAPISRILLEDYSGVRDAVRLLRFGGPAKYGDKILDVFGFYSTSSFFHIFSFDLTVGDRTTALDEPFSMVIAQETARRFFGNENPLGKVLTLEEGDFRITGVLKDLPPGQRTHIDFEMLVSFSTLQALQRQGVAVLNPDEWVSHWQWYHYILLEKEKTQAEIESVFPEIVARNYTDESPYEYKLSLQPLTGIALGPELVNQIGRGVMENVGLYIFLVIAFVIMLPVIFNYVSLTMARSLKRAKEIGVRKVIGANRLQVIKQFLIESVIIATISLIPAFLLLYYVLPNLNDFDFAQYLSTDWQSDFTVYLFFIAFSIFAGLLAGLLPSLLLSKMRPVQVLKGLSQIKGFSGLTMRKILLTCQFVLSLFFIIFTTLMYRQVKYMVNANYGFDKENIVAVSLQDVPYKIFRNELSKSSHIVDVSATSDLIGRVNVRPFLPIQSDKLAEPINAVRFFISENYLDNLGFTLLAGRSFSKDFATYSTQALILNETATHRLGYANPLEAVGQTLKVAENTDMHIIGVVQDFHYTRLHTHGGIAPVVLRYHPDAFQHAMVRIAPGDITLAIDDIEAAWNAVKGTELKPMHYRFLNEHILGAYNDARDIVTFFSIIASLAIFVACLGLLGMAIYSTETRIKEIGIRKVFGASAARIVILLSKDMVKLLAIAIAISSAFAWFFVTNIFMERFPYRAEIGPDIFIAGIALVAFLALVTIGSQTLKASVSNPVETLRSE